ncbi:MAG: radical SAM family heme chaperone HemW [Peptococcaceae bacterium]|nr:radical SAM family heme chaperone HemW [Peptococcaceae bacterium]
MSVGIYVHVPFCVRKCYYCDFVSYPFDRVDVDLYLRALPLEITMRVPELTASQREAATVFFGGGTPSTIPGHLLAKVLDTIREHFTLLQDAEITMEANPKTLEVEKMAALRRAGVNRISLGFQAAQDHILERLGRTHKLQDVYEAVKMVRDAGFDNMNLDLIYGIPGQTMDEWHVTLETALSFFPEHVACYGLEIVPKTPLGQAVAKGDLNPCPEELQVEMYYLARNILREAGFEHYELSNFARPGRASRHNLGYWHNEEYCGFGPAAHSYLNGCRMANEKDVLLYAEKLYTGKLPVVERECLDLRTQMAETMFLGLRLLKGVSKNDFRTRFGVDVYDIYKDEITRLQGEGLLEGTGDYLRLTEKALPIANEVFQRFL